MKLYLVRHGETVENKKGILMGHLHGSLTQLGIEQSEKLATKLKKISFDRIYSSDLGRCVATAKVIKKYHPQTQITFTTGLREFNFGELQGLKRKLINTKLDKLLDDTNFSFKRGESINNIQQRLKQIIASVYAKYPDGTVLFITHSAVVKNIIALFRNIPIKVVQKNVHIKNASVLVFNFPKANEGIIESMDGVVVDDSDLQLT